ncbi:hypothetical protein [Oceanobacillus neutriphilus]|nr:hypothetical protein [Oceanobacillus neutriphilus]
MGLQILGWSFVVIGVVIILWGLFEFPMNQWLGLDFLSFAASGMVAIAIGLAICKAAAFLIIAAILVTALLLILYIWQAAMGMGMSIISYVVTAALVTWLISLVLK